MLRHQNAKEVKSIYESTYSQAQPKSSLNFEKLSCLLSIKKSCMLSLLS